MKTSFILLVIILSINVSAQHLTGKIFGKVTDFVTGEALIGANVIIDNTKFGASTDLDGNYTLLNIPPGLYKLTAKYIGYEDLSKDSVLVESNKTTRISFQLTPGAYEISEVLITAEKPVVYKNLISNISKE